MKPYHLFTVRALGRPDFSPLGVAADFSGQVMVDPLQTTQFLPQLDPGWTVVRNGLAIPERGSAAYRDLPLWLRVSKHASPLVVRNARNTLWTKTDWREKKRANAQFARAFSIPMPDCLTPAEREGLARAFCHNELVARGMVADWSLNQGPPASTRVGHVPHTLKILATLRPFSQGKMVNKQRDWNQRELFFIWREKWHALLRAVLVQAEPRLADDAHALRQCRQWIEKCDERLLAEKERKNKSSDAQEPAAVILASEPVLPTPPVSRTRRL